MGFRFQILNPICRASLARLSSRETLLHRPCIGLSVNPSFNISRRWHFGHPDHHHHQSSGEEGEKIFRLGLTADIGLSVGKALTGYLCGSTAIIADAAHSVSDVVIRFETVNYIINWYREMILCVSHHRQVLSGVALLSYRAANVPKDKEHPYGFKLALTLSFFSFIIVMCNFIFFGRSW